MNKEYYSSTADSHEATATADGVSEYILDSSEDLEIDLGVARLERDCDPQLDWPESDPAGHISDEGYNRRLNYRLTRVGYLLDAVRLHIEDEAAAQEWLSLKRAVQDTKLQSNIYAKIDPVIELEAFVYDFTKSFNVTESDYIAVQ